MSGVSQVTSADMLAGSKGMLDNIDGLNATYARIASLAEEMAQTHMKGAAGTAVNMKLAETNQHVIKTNTVATDKAQAVTQHVHHTEQAEANSASFITGLA